MNGICYLVGVSQRPSRARKREADALPGVRPPQRTSPGLFSTPASGRNNGWEAIRLGKELVQKAGYVDAIALGRCPLRPKGGRSDAKIVVA
jgi:hypothetical protein